ncbi:hypothetical protein QG37_04076 [Candidozyma auris]|uniref:Uncharacterized protein n=1 Tax=Candidozyma auris TaxID=498019 RepID=A0A0L0NZA7_CANAR|nr:hypothetical protein QG37_04076 [[Candida] auris]
MVWGRFWGWGEERIRKEGIGGNWKAVGGL